MNLMRSALLLIILSLSIPAVGQDRLPTMPRYDRYEKLRREILGSVKRGDVRVRWAEDSKSFTFQRDGKTYRYDIAARKTSEAEAPPAPQGRQGRTRRNPERGRQFDTVYSPDESRKAFHRDRNVFISDQDGKNEIAVTTEGSAQARTKFGVASWVYGEELGVREAMWFSPNGKKLAFYKFDESLVPDYYLALEVLRFQNRLDAEAYPKAGAPNPKVELYVYDVESRRTKAVDIAFDSGGGGELAHYVYEVRWSPKGDELLFNRTNRKQNTMEFCAADPETGKCRVVIRESDPDAWTENSPPIRWLEDQKRFLWLSERNGYRNLYLYDLSGKLIRPLTQHKSFEVSSIARVDEKAGRVFYMARSGENPYLAQLHVVGLDGKGDRRLTDPKLSHAVEISPDGKFFTDVTEAIDTPPVTRLVDASGKVADELAVSDLSKFQELKLHKAERFTYLAADGKTTLYGTLHRPSDFDPSRKYPLIVSVYAGPDSSGGPERFVVPEAIAEFGFLLAHFDGRGTNGRGKWFKNQVYGKLGVVEIDDQAAGVKSLRTRPYVDGARVGIYGTSYGGYAAAMALLRHPDVFHAACASSPVTDWRNYDTIYTERYMGLPWEGENKAGYDAGSALGYARNIKGRLLLYYGTADNNVHPANTYQLVRALASAGKSFDMMVGPDIGHSGINASRMWEFFIDNLILRSGETMQAAWADLKRRRLASGTSQAWRASKGARP